jgi:hypothetical protein
MTRTETDGARWKTFPMPRAPPSARACKSGASTAPRTRCLRKCRAWTSTLPTPPAAVRPPWHSISGMKKSEISRRKAAAQTLVTPQPHAARHEAQPSRGRGRRGKGAGLCESGPIARLSCVAAVPRSLWVARCALIYSCSPAFGVSVAVGAGEGKRLHAAARSPGRCECGPAVDELLRELGTWRCSSPERQPQVPADCRGRARGTVAWPVTGGRMPAPGTDVPARLRVGRASRHIHCVCGFFACAVANIFYLTASQATAAVCPPSCAEDVAPGSYIRSKQNKKPSLRCCSIHADAARVSSGLFCLTPWYSTPTMTVGAILSCCALYATLEHDRPLDVGIPTRPLSMSGPVETAAASHATCAPSRDEPELAGLISEMHSSKLERLAFCVHSERELVRPPALPSGATTDETSPSWNSTPTLKGNATLLHTVDKYAGRAANRATPEARTAVGVEGDAIQFRETNTSAVAATKLCTQTVIPVEDTWLTDAVIFVNAAVSLPRWSSRRMNVVATCGADGKARSYGTLWQR